MSALTLNIPDFSKEYFFKRNGLISFSHEVTNSFDGILQ
jgi:hypothetical protein